MTKRPSRKAHAEKFKAKGPQCELFWPEYLSMAIWLQSKIMVEFSRPDAFSTQVCARMSWHRVSAKTFRHSSFSHHLGIKMFFPFWGTCICKQWSCPADLLILRLIDGPLKKPIDHIHQNIVHSQMLYFGLWPYAMLLSCRASTSPAIATCTVCYTSGSSAPGQGLC